MIWQNICNLQSNDPNLSCNNYFNNITYFSDEFVPFRKVTRKEYKLMLKFWISKEILRKCKERDSLFNELLTKSILLTKCFTG